MKSYNDNNILFFIFVYCISLLFILLFLFKLKDNNQKLQTQIDELRMIFNQKFLQEMVTDQPKLRTLEYRPDHQAKLIRISI
jgi:predicted Holliday junction resolvase-like endonuclease